MLGKKSNRNNDCYDLIMVTKRQHIKIQSAIFKLI